jgi:hypothetical protein
MVGGQGFQVGVVADRNVTVDNDLDPAHHVHKPRGTVPHDKRHGSQREQNEPFRRAESGISSVQGPVQRVAADSVKGQS